MIKFNADSLQRFFGGFGRLRRLSLLIALGLATAVIAQAVTLSDPPTGVSAIAGNALAVVTFTAPVNNGGAAITSYNLAATPVGGGTVITASGASSPLTITGLTNGTNYTLAVTATNSVGASAAANVSILPGDWARNYGKSAGIAVIYATATDALGDVYIAGFTNTTFTLGGVTLTKIGTQDAFAAKINSGGVVVWAKNFGGSGATVSGRGIAVDSTGNVYLCGLFNNASLTVPALTKIGTQDAFAVKLAAADGAITWAKNFGGSGATVYGNSIGVDSTGNVYLGGEIGRAHV